MARADFCPFWSLPDPPACLRQRGPCGKNRPLGGSLLGRFPEYRARCRSSVVEHSIGNGEVDSSILSGSTSYRLEVIVLYKNDFLSVFIFQRNTRVTPAILPCAGSQ